LCPSPLRPSWPSSGLSWPCLIHRQGPSPDGCPVQLLDGRLGLGIVGHLDKAKAPRTAGLAIRGNSSLRDGAKRLKELREVVFRGRKREIADKDIYALFPSVRSLV